MIATFFFSNVCLPTISVIIVIGNYQKLLESVVANPAKSVSTLPILTKHEKYQLLVEWNTTEVAYPGTSCLHQLFEKQVGQTPDAIAVIFENQEWLITLNVIEKGEFQLDMTYNITLL